MLQVSNFSFIFKTYSNSLARIGRLTTPHGVINTPAFVFCGTKACIKGVTPKQLQESGTQIILSNTYHLMLNPGGLIVQRLGGLQKMIGWHKPMLTDSGGFQMFSLGNNSLSVENKGKNLRYPNSLFKIEESGAIFRSYIDGLFYCLTPEKSIQIQRQLGADLVVTLDECTPFFVDKSYTRKSMEMTHRWLSRSLFEFNLKNDYSQVLYGVVQGGVYQDLREISTYFVNTKEFFGHAIGGSLGVDKYQMYDIISFTVERLSKRRPIHLLGVGCIRDIFLGVYQGIDTFDCVYPTRLARHGGALIKPNEWCGKGSIVREYINLCNTKFSLDINPISNTCHCETCKIFSKGYLHYLLKSKETLAIQAISVHNISFINYMMYKIRKAISKGMLGLEEQNWLIK